MPVVTLATLPIFTLCVVLQRQILDALVQYVPACATPAPATVVRCQPAAYPSRTEVYLPRRVLGGRQRGNTCRRVHTMGAVARLRSESEKSLPQHAHWEECGSPSPISRGALAYKHPPRASDGRGDTRRRLLDQFNFHEQLDFVADDQAAVR